MAHKNIDFEKLFLKGHKSYDTAIGDWWEGQASNGAHRKAYAAVADMWPSALGRASSKRARASVLLPR